MGGEKLGVIQYERHFSHKLERKRSNLREHGKYFQNRCHGVGPISRFFRYDNATTVCPTPRFLLFLFLGSWLSIIGIRLTADQYYEGPQLTFPYHRLSSDETEFPVHIAFDNIGCYVAGVSNPIVTNISGEIRPGKVTGILGQSGSGKSTLCNMILGRGKRYCTKSVYGTVYLNGRPRDLEAFLDRVGFVPQEDVLHPHLTIEETLMLSADWRLPRDASAAYKRQVVQDTLKTLDLFKIRDRRIGNRYLGGISGGEKKRTSIGMELVALPSVLVMDEPTSGLDSAGAYQLISMLQKIALRGVSVVAVLHQPSERVFSHLDDVILLQDGEAAYIGPREGALPFLQKIGYGKKEMVSTSVKTSSAEFILDVLARLEVPEENVIDNFLRQLCLESSFGRYGFPSKNLTNEENISHDVKNECLSTSDNMTHPFLPTFFRFHCTQTEYWKNIAAEMSAKRNAEYLKQCIEKKWKEKIRSKDYENLGKYIEKEWRLWHSNLQRECTDRLWNAGDYQDSDDVWTRFIRFLKREKKSQSSENSSISPSYLQLPKPGFKSQILLWIRLLTRLKWRRGLFLEAFIIASLAQVVGFVRSFNSSWNRRAVSNLFLSISIGLLGMVGAVFNDEIGPVQRAVSAGMLLGAHEFAVLAESIIWGWFVSHIFALNYFAVMWIRTNVWILDFPETSNHLEYVFRVRFQKYYEFAHLLHLNYLASGSLGNAICVFADHDTTVSYVASVAVLMACHVFALFSPNQNQVRNDSKLFRGVVDIGGFVETICSLSYVRYFLEIIFLWDSSSKDAHGRQYVMRYFGYKDSNKAHCATCIFALWTCSQAVRFLVFSFKNSNDFHSLYDTPLFIIFISKVLSCHFVALILMTSIQEWYFPWVASLQERVLEMEVRYSR